MSAGNVPPFVPRTKADVSDALAKDWLAFAPLGQREQKAPLIGASEGKTLSKAISGEHLPEAHTILNTLGVDPAGLFHTLSLFGGVFVPCRAISGEDYATIRKMLHAATEYMDRMQDGRRCHVDTAALAKQLVPLVPAMLAIIQEANGEKAPIAEASVPTALRTVA